MLIICIIIIMTFIISMMIIIINGVKWKKTYSRSKLR